MSRIDTHEQRVNWFQVLEDLRRKGIPVASVAKHIGVPKGTVMGWKNDGAEPKYLDGQMLVDLWVGVTGENQHRLPRANEAK